MIRVVLVLGVGEVSSLVPLTAHEVFFVQFVDGPVVDKIIALLNVATTVGILLNSVPTIDHLASAELFGVVHASLECLTYALKRARGVARHGRPRYRTIHVCRIVVVRLWRGLLLQKTINLFIDNFLLLLIKGISLMEFIWLACLSRKSSIEGSRAISR